MFFQTFQIFLLPSPSPLHPSPPSSEPTCVSQVCVGPRRVGGTDRRQLVTCILCQEEQEVRGHGRAMVLAAFVQRSTVLSKNRSHNLPDPGGWSLTLTSLKAANQCWMTNVLLCYRALQSSLHAPRSLPGDSHSQLWTHHACHLLAEVRHCKLSGVSNSPYWGGRALEVESGWDWAGFTSGTIYCITWRSNQFPGIWIWNVVGHTTFLPN